MNTLRFKFLGMALVHAGLFAPIASSQTITNLPDGPQTLSGRIRLVGSGFGSSGQVQVDGITAITTEWSNAEIHAYIPEASSLGLVNVQVSVSGGTSNTVQQDVLPRVADGRVAWRFKMSSVNPPRNGAAVASDGTVYVDDSGGRLFALSPAGALLWMYDGNQGVQGGGLEGPVSLGADGTIYYATNPLGTEVRIHAVNPDGTQRWMFQEFSLALGVIAGPSVGPDGNIYAVFDRAHLGTLGAFSLDPNGNLRWSSPGTPFINHEGALPDRIEFGPDAFYVAFREDGVAQANHIFGFEFNGTQRFALPFVWASGRPHVRADGSMVVRWGQDNVLRSLDAFGGTQWSLITSGNLSEPVLGSNGDTYIFLPQNRLVALRADGTERWVVQSSALGWMNFLGASPDGQTLMDGGRMGFGQPGWIRGYRTSDGALEWNIDLPTEINGNAPADLVVQGEPAFTQDSSRVYVPVNALVTVPVDFHTYLYAVDQGEPGIALEDCFGEFICPCGNADPQAGCQNSTGQGAHLGVTAGGVSWSADDMQLSASGVPANSFGLLFIGQRSISSPLGDGARCVAAGPLGLHRLQVQNSGASGTLVEGPGIAAYTLGAFGSSGIAPGSTWRFQAWYRDQSGPCGSGFNFSNAVQVTYAP